MSIGDSLAQTQLSKLSETQQKLGPTAKAVIWHAKDRWHQQSCSHLGAAFLFLTGSVVFAVDLGG